MLPSGPAFHIHPCEPLLVRNTSSFTFALFSQSLARRAMFSASLFRPFATASLLSSPVATSCFAAPLAPLFFTNNHRFFGSTGSNYLPDPSDQPIMLRPSLASLIKPAKKKKQLYEQACANGAGTFRYPAMLRPGPGMLYPLFHVQKHDAIFVFLFFVLSLFGCFFYFQLISCSVLMLVSRSRMDSSPSEEKENDYGEAYSKRSQQHDHV